MSWATVDQVGFVNTAATELDGTGGAAAYGPPYNNGTDSVQQVGPVNWQKLAGITQPINAATLFVLDPLAVQAKSSPAVATALATYTGAPASQQQKWAAAYDKATAPGAKKVPFNGGALNLPAAGPVPAMMAGELLMARSGALDTDLLAQRQFYGTDFTKPLLFIADGGYYNTLASNMHLTGDQWGVMNETGSYPGQPWLWLFQMWYHVSPFQNSASVDIWAVYLTGIATVLLLLVPFIPGLRDLPRLIPVHRLIWRGDWTQPGDQAASHSRARGREPAGEGRTVSRPTSWHMQGSSGPLRSGPDDLLFRLLRDQLVPGHDLGADHDDVRDSPAEPRPQARPVPPDGVCFRRQPGHPHDYDGPAESPAQIQDVSLIGDNRAVAGRRCRNRRARRQPDHDGVVLDYVVDRPDRRERLTSEDEAADGHAGQPPHCLGARQFTHAPLVGHDLSSSPVPVRHAQFMLGTRACRTQGRWTYAWRTLVLPRCHRRRDGEGPWPPGRLAAAPTAHDWARWWTDAEQAMTGP